MAYLASSRYIIDSSFALIADVFVLVFCIEQKEGKKFLLQNIGLTSAVFIISGVIYTDYHEITVSKFRKLYDDNLIQMMLDLDNYSDEELAPFQANSPEQVRRGVEIMKKYKLGVFYYIDE